MEKATRAQILRQRHKALYGALLRPKGAVVKRRTTNQPKPFRFDYQFDFSKAPSVPVLWVREADKPKERPKVQPRRIALKSPLWGIAEKWADRPRMPKRLLASRR
jgi:hypothetical protein